MKLKLALIGAGGYGSLYTQALLTEATARGAVFVGAVDPMVEKLPSYKRLIERGVAVFPTLSALYGSGLRPDLVVIASPPHFHAEQALMAMEMGSDVLCEKPLSATPKDATRMMNGRDRTGRRLAVGFQWAFSPGVARLKRDILDGLYGRPTQFRTRVYWPRNKSYYSRNGWAGRVKTADGRMVYDSPVNNACAHFVHNMLYLLGDSRHAVAWPLTVTAELYRANAIENYDTAVLHCTTENGATIFAVVTHATESALEPTFELEFEGGNVVSSAAESYQIVGTTKDGRRKDYGPQPSGDDLTKLWVTIDAIRHGKPLPCPAESAAAHTALTHAAQLSSMPTAFPGHLISERRHKDHTAVSVAGLEEVLDQAYATGSFPSELGLPWAQPGVPVRVHGLSRFEAALAEDRTIVA